MQVVPGKPLSHIWLKAAVVGSMWASIEIILGSFLHNLKIPFSGTILSFISVYLLISFLQFWKENGLVWRAGIICALMKSISPSAFILGPMIGIFSEALLIEFFIFVFGKNLLGYMTGGAFAVMSTLFQKIINLLILYGFNFIKILSDLYQFAVKQINLKDLSPDYLIIVIIVLYVITGVTAGVAGYIAGSNYTRHRAYPEKFSDMVLRSENQIFGPMVPQNYSILLLIINFLSIAVLLLLINSEFIIPTVVLSVLYLGFCIYNYRTSLKRLTKLSFWLSFLVITFAAAFLWNGFSRGVFFSSAGLIVGLRMNARAVIMIIGFASVSVELRNPIVKSILYHRGLSSLYQSLNLAFSSLPFFITSLSKNENRHAFSRIHIKELFSKAEILFKVFELEHRKRSQVVIITGDIHQGKTTFVRKLVQRLQEKKIALAGFLSIGINENGRRSGFNLLNIETEEQSELCSDKKNEDKIQFGMFYFNKSAIARGNEILNIENLKGRQLIIIDEIGPLELKDQGWSSSIDAITRGLVLPQLWVVRKALINNIIRKWNIGDAFVFDISDSSIYDVEKKLEELMV